MILHVHLPIEPHSTKVLVLYRTWWINGNGCRKLLSFPISVPREWKPPCMPCLLVAITLETLFPAVGEHYFLRHLRSIPMAQLERVINSPISGKHHCWLQYFPWFLWWHFSTSFLMSSREIVLWTQTPARREIRCGDATGILVMIDCLDGGDAEEKWTPCLADSGNYQRCLKNILIDFPSWQKWSGHKLFPEAIAHWQRGQETPDVATVPISQCSQASCRKNWI